MTTVDDQKLLINDLISSYKLLCKYLLLLNICLIGTIICLVFCYFMFPSTVDIDLDQIKTLDSMQIVGD